MEVRKFTSVRLIPSTFELDQVKIRSLNDVIFIFTWTNVNYTLIFCYGVDFQTSTCVIRFLMRAVARENICCKMCTSYCVLKYKRKIDEWQIVSDLSNTRDATSLSLKLFKSLSPSVKSNAVLATWKSAFCFDLSSISTHAWKSF